MSFSTAETPGGTWITHGHPSYCMEAIAEILPSIQPVLTKFEIATVEEVHQETLADRLWDEVRANQLPIQRGTFVSAWSTKP
jgi:hypothetical protein